MRLAVSMPGCRSETLGTAGNTAGDELTNAEQL